MLQNDQMNTRNGPFHFHVSHTVHMRWPARPALTDPIRDIDLRKSQQSANEVDVHVACGSARGEHTTYLRDRISQKSTCAKTTGMT